MMQTKGYQKESTIQIEGVEKLFADIGKAIYVKICKARSSSTPKLSELFLLFLLFLLVFLRETCSYLRWAVPVSATHQHCLPSTVSTGSFMMRTASFLPSLVLASRIAKHRTQPTVS